MQTVDLENLVYHPHSQISIKILSLKLFHKFVEIRACGRQCTPDIVLWLRLVSKIVTGILASQTYVQ